VVKVGLKRWGNAFLPLLSLPSPPAPAFSFPFLHSSFSLRNRASQLGGWGSAVSSPSGVWGGAPAKIEFGAFLPQNLITDGHNFYDFLGINRVVVSVSTYRF